MIICHWAKLHYNMSFQIIAGRSDGVFWWFPALSEDQEKICWIHQNYLLALKLTRPDNNNNNNNNRFLYSAFPNYHQSTSQCIITPVIGFRINSALQVHFLHSLGSIPASRHFQARTMPTQPQYRSHPTGSPFNTWVESSNVDKVSCWRTKVYRATVGFEPGLSTRDSSVHTTIPRHLRAGRETTLHVDAATCILHTPHSLLAPDHDGSTLRELA